ncbi:adhesion G protein-coupled receptor A2-like [Chiloscyllium plagiosum]|uniref:adhesion G protein-coupled receptor A2-like n=1 Tax=Chiloscyllium plagiosum TaxID=36176 RepID=UPI001CB7D0F5|nr:adhesion G protein-coupled receptor A2-like [Chiloscyllium plagiosum]
MKAKFTDDAKNSGKADCCSELLTNTCICIEERPKGASYPEVRRKVVCSKQELQDVPQSSLLPNRTGHLAQKAILFRDDEKLNDEAESPRGSQRRWDPAEGIPEETGSCRGDPRGNGILPSGSQRRLDLRGDGILPSGSQRRRDPRGDGILSSGSQRRRDPRGDGILPNGPLELPILQLIPSLRQVVFQGDRLPFLCTATYLDNSTRVLWYHNNMLVQPQEDGAAITVESLIHDCSLISSELILSNIYLLASGEWECVITTSRGKVSRKVDIVVIDTSATYCQAEQVTNNRGEFRWPRTLAGITVYQPCLQYPYPSSSVNGVSLEKRTSRKCQRSGQWEEADYSECLYTNDYTRVLYTFILMPINSSNALTLAHQLLAYTVEAANFCDMMDVIYVAQMIEKFISFTAEIHDLSDLVVEMASNMMLVDEHVLWMAQQDSAACSRIVRSVEHIAVLTLASDSQAITKVSTNIAVEAFLVKPAGYMGLSCTAFQREHPFPNREGQVHGTRPQLSFRCNTGNLTGSLRNFPVKNSIALASVQLPLSLFSQSAPGPGGNSSSCRLQFVVFRNGKLFPSTGNSSNLADQSRQRSPSTPVIFTGTDGCGVSEARDPILVSLRHWQTGEDQVAAHWNFELLNGYGGWQVAGCHITHTKANITSMWCHTFSNMAVLKIRNQPVPTPGAIQALHPIIYSCTVVLLICLFIAIITYILKHNTIRVSRKNWHMLLNLWFHISMTCAVFTGGINRTEYGLICQVVSADWSCTERWV